MFPECKKCMGAGIVGISAAFILHCPIDLDKHKCPYISDNQHTHQEIYIPPQFSQSSVTVATSAIPPDHPDIIHVSEDPNKDGSKLYFINVG